jgi:glycosyltransferase involved in cell wall biosynthesis
MAEFPLVSIIVPTYNSAPYVSEAVGSVLRQTYGKLEIVLVDDGSTDGTEEILRKRLRDKRIRYIWQENAGPGAARNTGIRAAQGSYLAFLDADDTLTPDSLKARMILMMSVPGLRLVYANYFIKQSEDRTEPRFDDQYLRGHRCLRRETPYGVVLEGSFPDFFDIPFDMWTGMVLAERRLVKQAGLFRTDIRIGEDRDMWLRLSLNAGGAIGYVRSPTACYNQYRSELTGRDPIRYAQMRERLNRVFRETYGPLAGRVQTKKVIDSRLSWIYYDLGVHFDNENRKARAAWYLLRSLWFDSSNRVSRRHLASLILPRGIVAGMKKALGFR